MQAGGGGGGQTEGRRTLLEKLMREGVEEGDLDGMFEAGEEGTFDVFLGPMQQAAKAGLGSGGQARIGGVGIDYSFNLKNPGAQAYLEAHGAALVKQINEETRGRVKALVNRAMDEGWAYSQTARSRVGLYGEFAEGKAQEHIDSPADFIAVTEAGGAGG